MGGEANIMNSISNIVAVVTNLILPWATVALAIAAFLYLKATRDLVDETKCLRKQGLYSKRLKVFDSLMLFLGDCRGNIEEGSRKIGSLLQGTHDAEFLFPGDAVDVIDQVHKKTNEWRMEKTRLDEVSADLARENKLGTARPDLEGRQRELKLQLMAVERWLHIDAWDLAKEKFKPHLTLRDA